MLVNKQLLCVCSDFSVSLASECVLQTAWETEQIRTRTSHVECCPLVLHGMVWFWYLCFSRFSVVLNHFALVGSDFSNVIFISGVLSCFRWFWMHITCWFSTLGLFLFLGSSWFWLVPVLCGFVLIVLFLLVLTGSDFSEWFEFDLEGSRRISVGSNLWGSNWFWSLVLVSGFGWFYFSWSTWFGLIVACSSRVWILFFLMVLISLVHLSLGCFLFLGFLLVLISLVLSRFGWFWFLSSSLFRWFWVLLFLLFWADLGWL